MNIKKNKIVIVLIVLIAIILPVAFLLYHNYEKDNAENYFFVETPINRYSKLTSSYKGYPFIIKCNNNQKITVTFTGGILLDEKKQLESQTNEFTLPCQTTIYWNENNENLDTVNFTFTSSDTMQNAQIFTLLKKENEEYHLQNKNL